MEATQSQNRQHSNSVLVFLKKKWANNEENSIHKYSITGNSNNIVFTLFPIMNKMRV